MGPADIRQSSFLNIRFCLDRSLANVKVTDSFPLTCLYLLKSDTITSVSPERHPSRSYFFLIIYLQNPLFPSYRPCVGVRGSRIHTSGLAMVRLGICIVFCHFKVRSFFFGNVPLTDPCAPLSSTLNQEPLRTLICLRQCTTDLINFP